MHLPDTRPIYISSRLSTTTPDGRPAAASVGSPHGDAQGRAARRGRTSPSWRRKVRKFGGRALHYPPPAPDFSSSTHEPTSPQHCSGESAHAHLRGAGALRTIVVYVRPVLEHQSGQRRVQSESNQ